MKKSLLFSSFILCSFIGFGQCPTSPITLSSQADVDAFATTYPGCSELLDNLIISGGDINDLSPLNTITDIQGTLDINVNPLLVTLGGLDNITAVGSLYIANNLVLLNLDGLDNLTSICQDPGFPGLSIGNNPSLISIQALSGATGCLRNLGVVNNPSLLSLEGLEGFAVSNISASVGIGQNDALTSLIGLSGLVSPEYGMFITYNAGLINLDGLDNLVSVPDGILIEGNASLESISLPNLVYTNSLEIRDNPMLTSVQGFAGLSDTALLEFTNNPALTTIAPVQGGVFYDIHLENNDSLEDLSFLQDVDYIHAFRIIDNDQLTNFSGIEATIFSKVITPVIIENNDILIDISAMGTVDISSIPELQIRNNPNLSFCSVQSICDYLGAGGDSIIENNDLGCNNVPEVEAGCGFPVCPTSSMTLASQADVDNFPITYNGCSQINGSLTITGSDITDLSPLSGLTFVEQDLFIGGTSLTDLSGLVGLTEIGGLVITNNPLLTHLTGLENIETMCYGMGDNDIYILNNTNLISIASLTNVSNSCLVSLNISNNPSLLTLEGLNNIDPFEFLTISYNDALVDLQGLEGVNHLEDDLNIQNNNALTSLVGLQNLASVMQLITILNNDSLLAIDFPNILEMSHLTIDGNPNLTSISGFTYNSDPAVYIRNNPLLTSAGIAPFGAGLYGFEITNNDSLTDLSFMAGLDTIEGFVIRDNDGLTSFNGLEATAFYTGIDVIIDNNSQLVDISAMAWTDLSDITMLRIKNNDLLSLCSEPSICTYLMGGGASEIKNNNGGCNTAQEIMAACFLSNGDLILEENISLYPNPVSEILQIHTSEGITLQKATVFSILGEELISTSEETIDFSTLSEGIYFVLVDTDKGSITKKIVKE